MTLLHRIHGPARALIVAAASFILVCSAHHSFTAVDSLGGLAMASTAEVADEPSAQARAEAEALAVQKLGSIPPDGLTTVAARPLGSSPTGPVIALTFDDGPWPGQTEQILGILSDRQVPATFFMLGTQVERAPGLAQYVAQLGHGIGNHSYSHRRLDDAPPDVAAWEIAWAEYRIESVTGVHPTWVRPPGGNFGPTVYAAIGNINARPVLWTVDPQDWRAETTPEEIAWNVISTARPGGVILLHDGGGDQSKTIAALPAIIDALRAQGYTFVTLDQLPEVRGGW